MNTNPQRTGFLTSEFAGMIIATVVGILVMSGKVTPDAGNVIVQGVSDIFGAIIVIISMVAYNDGRVELKKALIQQTPVAGNSAAPNPPVDATPAAS